MFVTFHTILSHKETHSKPSSHHFIHPIYVNNLPHSLNGPTWVISFLCLVSALSCLRSETQGGTHWCLCAMHHVCRGLAVEATLSYSQLVKCHSLSMTFLGATVTSNVLNVSVTASKLPSPSAPRHTWPGARVVDRFKTKTVTHTELWPKCSCVFTQTQDFSSCESVWVVC